MKAASAQTLAESERRVLARWAAACAERVLPLFVADAASVESVADALERTRRFADGDSTAAEEISKRMVAVKAAGAASTPAGAAAARSVAQASGVAHMGAHALGAAAYAAKAVGLAHPAEPDAINTEVRWQIDQLTSDQRSLLALLPRLGEDTSGPLGPGLLSGGVLGEVIRNIQAELSRSA